MINARRFYGSRNPQNPAVLSSSKPKEESEDITCEDSDFYDPSELSSSDLFVSNFNETTLMIMVKQAAVLIVGPLFMVYC